MRQWGSRKGREVLDALESTGWEIARSKGSRKTLHRASWESFVFSFGDSEEIGPKMLARIAKKTGLAPENLA